ncbi:40S ribosomal protein S3-3 [Monoraphidium neglectum]|uniref:30S ribosomal protein S3, chloroplastic n=1 Tax=Monoraphidium neglectum TaxID=145388 RepID=A0A0D2MHV2_9CHLO|nr:40S ribosomal protein S3-3 [Monoraphidium neglectum]KIZ00267.1 40S ribosomal protein S3-3 [Monoraphidium neglectum]|eukprot:XP_013899286.1 40S ribosomal protein S3-3 [Monoraphidium neglectum]
MAERMQRAPIPVPSLPFGALQTAFVAPSGTYANSDAPPVVLLHGFDSSSLEMRRLHPLLEQEVEAWAVDLKREHLFSFWQEKIGRPMVLVGASLGGAIALEFALEYPEAVEKIVLIDAQGFIDGIGPMSTMPRPLAAAGVWVLRTEQLRMAANRMAYHDQAFATEDAMRVGRLHTHLDGWSDANIAFMRGGGYAISTRLGQVTQPVLVIWGRQDQILEPKYADQFLDVLPDARLVWLEGCGHCGHLEKPRETADAILGFINGGGAASDGRAGGAFVADGVFYAELNELLVRELAEDGYSGVEVRQTPMRTEIIIRATRTQNVLGEKGRRIRELTSVVQKRFNFPPETVELYAEKVANRGLCAVAQAESLRYKLLGGLAVRRRGGGAEERQRAGRGREGHGAASDGGRRRCWRQQLPGSQARELLQEQLL